MIRPVFALAALAVAGCATVSDDEARMALRTAAINYVAAMNAAGVDPVNLSEGERSILLANCALATGVATVWRPDMPEASDVILDFCAVAAKVAE